MNTNLSDPPTTSTNSLRSGIPEGLSMALGLLAPFLVVGAAIWLAGRGSAPAIDRASYDEWPAASPAGSDATPSSEQ